MDREDLAAWLRLSLAPGLGPSAARRLLAAFGLPRNVLDQGDAALSQLLTPGQKTALHTPPEGFDAQLDRTLKWLEEGAGSRRVLTLADADYPAALLGIEDPPLILYMQGLGLPAADAAVAVVGSRNPTAQGRDNARAFSRALAEAGLTVVSGMALGVDAAAHQGALDGAAPGAVATVAVVGTGLDRVYPKAHLELAHRIAERGALLSEYPLGTPPLRENFPRRNRLLSGLSRGTLVVEAALQSGSLITARLAAEQGKDVFAIPGSIHSPQARGCHALIKQGAKLVESAQDVLEELRPTGAAHANARATARSTEGDDLLDALGFDPVGLDALEARTGIATPALQARLLELELAGDVARLPGGLFQRRADA